MTKLFTGIAVPPRRLGLLFVLVLLVVPALAAPPVATNGPEPRDGTVEMQLEEIWRRGGEDDDEVLLGIVTSVLTDQDGNLYVLDAQLMEIKVFSPDGELTGTLGREGDGPGEFRGAQQISWLPDGGIGVAQTFPGKLVALNLDGTPGGEMTLGGDPAQGGFSVLINSRMGGGNLVVSGLDMAFNQADLTMDRYYFVRSYSMDGTMLQEYLGKDQTWTFNAEFTLRESESDFVWWRLAVNNAGQVVVGEPREDYLISVYNQDGTLARSFGREYETMPRTEKLMARYESMLEAQSRQLPPGTGLDVAPNEQDIWGIHCAGDGTTWVTTSRGMYDPPEGVFTAWDVFDAEGTYVREVEAKIPGTPGTDLLMLTDHGYAILVTGFWDAVLSVMGAGAENEEAEPMEIVCYRILKS